jgi:menaquinone-dependent protoporphyrinogen oxidase
MKVLVAYASRHGATKGIAERIAETVRQAGHEVDLERVQKVYRAEEYDAFVIGSAAYMFHWLKEATQFVRKHREVLASRPTWLFSSGPIGPETVDKKGRDVLETTRPRELAEFAQAVNPRDMRVFFGAFDPEAPPVGIAEKIMALTPAREAMPAGDFRDWPQIEAWAESIVRELKRFPLAAA